MTWRWEHMPEYSMPWLNSSESSCSEPEAPSSPEGSKSLPLPSNRDRRRRLLLGSGVLAPPSSSSCSLPPSSLSPARLILFLHDKTLQI